MQAELINPFIIAAREVLQQEIGSDVQIGQLSLDNHLLTSREVKVNIAMTGDVEGLIFYGLDQHQACQLASLMLGEPIGEFNKIVYSAVAEMGNVISGIATRELERAGYTTDISTPVVLVGEQAKINLVGLTYLVVQLTTAVGPLTLLVALRGVKNNC
ncbi:chemotaxis protein CheX [Carboxydocella sp. ULO1]|uniref:chemotaxis protein CheX n=1 Tax=Carboxydocella sp. ULO1 TaxID=1926599 RepID=UPI0009AE6C39|nr:chemotaxis protein CheX [Carboxydocella sp. ULO1]GAW27599.1 CheC domain protein [Carboxydocella sp. ULO1]